MSHVEEARRAINRVMVDESHDWPLVNATVAVAEATLELAEQQRIANIIALAKFTVIPGNMPEFRGVVFEGDRLRPDITAALGLS